jgi:hypothetical protein
VDLDAHRAVFEGLGSDLRQHVGQALKTGTAACQLALRSIPQDCRAENLKHNFKLKKQRNSLKQKQVEAELAQIEAE